jgi:hypothetical protein
MESRLRNPHSKRTSAGTRYNSATRPMKTRGLSGSVIALARHVLQARSWGCRNATSPMTIPPRSRSGVFAGSTAAPPGTARRVWLPVCRPPARSNYATYPPQRGQRKIITSVVEHARRPKRTALAPRSGRSAVISCERRIAILYQLRIRPRFRSSL